MDLNITLIQAASMGHIMTVRLMLKAGADVHAYNDWALQWATKNRHTDVVQLLQQHMDVKASQETI